MADKIGYFDDVRSSIQSFARLNVLFSIVSTGVIPAAIAVLCSYDKDVIKESPLLFWISLFVMFMVNIAYAVLSAGLKTAPESLLEVRKLSETISNLEQAISHLSNVDMLCKTWRVFVDEKTIRKIVSPQEVIDSIGVICKVLVDNRGGLYGFSRGELWNFAVYIFDPNSLELIPVWRDKASGHPSQGNGRNWRPGVGHVGITYSSKARKITLNSNLPDVFNLFKAPEDCYQSYDERTYVSLQTEPIITHDSRALGVIVATSDHAGRFNEANSLALSHMAGEIATLLALAWSGDMVELMRR